MSSHRDWFSKSGEHGHSKLSDWSNMLPDEAFNDKTVHLAEILAESFDERHARIGLWGENSLDYLIAFFAILRAGHIAVPLSTRFTAREMVDISKNAELSGLLAARDYPQEHRNALNALPTYAMAPKLDPNYKTGKVRLRELGEKDVAVMICTSGSSGRSKIIPLTLGALLDHATAVCAHLSVTWRDSWLLCLPLYHIGGLTIPFRCLVSGASLQIAHSADADEVNRMIDAEEVSFVSVVPTVLERMLSKRGSTPYPKSLRSIVVGGGPVSDALLARCPQAYATYGLSEAGSMVTCARPACPASERKTAGLPLPKTDVKIINDAGKEARKGEAGQIVVRGPGMARGYVGDSASSAAVFKSGWVWTGDIGSLDEHGFLHVHARRTDVVLSGGENVYPAEIEAAIKSHSRVVSVVVLPIEDPEWGQTPAAFIVISEGRPLEKIHIYHHLEDKLARHKFPKKIVITPKLPVLSNGKPDLVAIRKALAGK
jgi:O-succinylbenzoic acid--CoA ligase